MTVHVITTAQSANQSIEKTVPGIQITPSAEVEIRTWNAPARYGDAPRGASRLIRKSAALVVTPPAAIVTGALIQTFGYLGLMPALFVVAAYIAFVFYAIPSNKHGRS